MGCDEHADGLVVNALIDALGLGWIGEPSLPARQTGSQGRGPRAGTDERGGNRSAAPQNQPPDRPQRRRPPHTRKPAMDHAKDAAIDARVGAWRTKGNSVALGNLGEQIALRVLPRLGYEVLVTQRDLQGAVPDIVGHPTRSNPEDLIVVTPDGRLSTVNSKAAYASGSTKSSVDGTLKAPRMTEGQDRVEYYSPRAEYLSPLDGDAFGQVIKVDVVHKVAQMYEIGDDRSLTPVGGPIDIFDDIVAVCAAHGSRMPAPIGPNSAEQYE